VEVQGYLDNYIDAIVTDPSSGHPKTYWRKESWNLVRTLNRRYKMPWMCFRDYNEIVSMEKKVKGNETLKIDGRHSGSDT